MGKIALEGLEFFAYHGFSEEEQKIGNRYGIDITIETNFEEAAKHDKLTETIDYHALYRVIQQEMTQPAKLLENIAERIIEAVFEHFQEVNAVEVRVSKFNPPIGGICRRALVTLKKNSEN